MKLLLTNNLTHSQQIQINELVAAAQQHDGTKRLPFVSNMYNYFPEMQNDILAYEGDALVGVAAIYADVRPDDAGTEVFLIVHPEYRRQGVATELRKQVEATLKQFGYSKYSFVTERRFLDANPEFIKNTNLEINPATEFQLSMNPPTTPLPTDDELELSVMTKDLIPAMVKLSRRAFGGEEETEKPGPLHYINTMAKPEMLIYVLKKNGVLLGSTSVDMSDGYYLFSLEIDPDYQNNGYGTELVKLAVNELTKREPRILTLGVDADNPRALHVYQKAGFSIETEIVYLNAQI